MCMLSLLITIVEILMFLCMRFLLMNIFHTLNQTQQTFANQWLYYLSVYFALNKYILVNKY